MQFQIVAAIHPVHGGMSYKNEIPWHDSQELKHFRLITTLPNQTNILLMGANTYKSILKHSPTHEPLPGRHHVILSTSLYESQYKEFPDQVTICASWYQVKQWLEGYMSLNQNQNKNQNTITVHIVGGPHFLKQVWEQDFITIHHLILSYMMDTPSDMKCDAFFPPWPAHLYQFKSLKSFSSFDVETYSLKKQVSYLHQNQNQNQNIKSHDQSYRQLVESVLTNGKEKMTRNGPVLSVSGDTKMVFRLYDDDQKQLLIPLLTTKHVPFRLVAEEFCWMLRGSTDNEELLEKKVFFWSDNCTREYLDNQGLQHYEVNELGPIYGFQWRHFGADYIPRCERAEKKLNAKQAFDPAHPGVDQIYNLYQNLKQDPFGRRHIVTAWNPLDLAKKSKPALPSCHAWFQMFVENNHTDHDHKETKPILTCQIYQRSVDVAVGLPFNITFYALLTHLFAFLLDYQPGQLIWLGGDTHIYQDHIVNLKEQIQRKPFESPHILFEGNLQTIKNQIQDHTSFDQFLNQLSAESWSIQQYKHHPKIFYRMFA